jgi:hypothetical protein
MIRGGDFSMLKVWVGLEARSFLQASIDTVSLFTALIKNNSADALAGRTLRQVRPTVAKHLMFHTSLYIPFKIRLDFTTTKFTTHIEQLKGRCCDDECFCSNKWSRDQQL